MPQSSPCCSTAVFDPPCFLSSVNQWTTQKSPDGAYSVRTQGEEKNPLAISMRRNLSYRGGAQRGAGPAATNPQPAGFVATESMQLLRYSLFTPHRYELNMSSTSNSFFLLLHLLGADWGLHQLLRSDEHWNLPHEETWKSLFPHSLWRLSPSCSGISYATVRSTYKTNVRAFLRMPTTSHYAYSTGRYDCTIAT